MFTRKDYLDKKCTHEEYYAQFVTPEIFNLVSNQFKYVELLEAHKADPAFNTIPLGRWDFLAKVSYKKNVEKLMKDCGDYVTEAGMVCVLKQAAREIIKD